MNRMILLAILINFPFALFSQITTDPEFPVPSKAVTITFNSAEESRLGKYTGELYAHTGVHTTKDDWQHVIGKWGENNKQPKLTHKGDGVYELVITPSIKDFYSVNNDETITHLAMVFRAADNSVQTNDLFIKVFEEGLAINITSPTDKSIEINGKATISASSPIEATLKLFINDTEIKSVTGEKIETEYTFTNAGSQWIYATASDGQTTVKDSTLIYVKNAPVEESLPEGSRKGITYLNDTSARLVLFAPQKSFVFVLGEFNNWQINNDYEMKKDGDYFWIELTGLTAGKEYPFQYLIDAEFTIADPYTEQVSDPWNDEYIEPETYPNLLSYPKEKTSGMASVLQTAQQPYNWEVNTFSAPDKTEMVIYEMLIRDFTEEHTYASIINKLDYLEDLRINVLELMPVNEFEGNISWGYNPSFFFAPDKYYGHRNDLKKLIDECHKRGIAVVIDMVLNHSYGQSPFLQLYMNNYVPTEDNPWYNVNSNFQNSSLRWGADFNHDSPHTRELVDSINSFWMSEYKVDGFRFDFTKGFSNTPYGADSWGNEYDADRISNLKRMADEIWKRNENAYVILEHLADNDEEKELANYGMLLWGKMTDQYTELAKGNTADIKSGIHTQRGWTVPNLVSYMESHDEERIMYSVLQDGENLGSYNTRIVPTALERVEVNTAFFTLLPGPKMYWQFEELGYDVSINHPGRTDPKPILWNYLDNMHRQELFLAMANFNHLKQTQDIFSKGTFTMNLNNSMKWYRWTHGNQIALVIGNFGLSADSYNLYFPETGTWYDYFMQSSLEITENSNAIDLAPGKYKVFTNFQMEKPQVINSVKQTISQTNNAFAYPNPANESITISLRNLEKIELINTNGQVLKVENSRNSDRHPIDVSNLKCGIYIVRVTDCNKEVKWVKFVKN